MKLANDALFAIISAFRKGIVEGIDVSDILRAIDLVPDDSGKLRLNPQHDDIWSPKAMS